MTPSLAHQYQKRKWYGLALRHLRVCSRLLRAEFPDAVVFHSYHAFECVLNAFIAWKGYDVPPQGWTVITLPSGKKFRHYPSPGGGVAERSEHKARLQLFKELADPAKPYFRIYSTLSRFMTLNDRNNALYYDAIFDQLPHERYNMPDAEAMYKDVYAFIRSVGQEIR